MKCSKRDDAVYQSAERKNLFDAQARFMPATLDSFRKLTRARNGAAR
jgi:hypothetical protein